MGVDKYYGQVLTIGDPSNCPVVPNLSDTVDLTYGEPNYIYVGTAGTLNADYKDAPVNPVSMKLGVGYHLLRPQRIRATGTSATDIVCLYEKVS